MSRKTVQTRRVGAICKKFRESMGCLQSDVAIETSYSKENVSSFETGRNDNYRILLWYLSHGLNLLKELEDYEEKTE